jgi:hypothetical protein
LELFRFRNVRPVLSQPCDGLFVTKLFDPPLDAEALQKAVDDFAAEAGENSVASASPELPWLDDFSSQLALRSDLVSPKECIGLLPSDWLSQVGTQEWIALGHQLAYGLMAAMSKSQPAPAVELLCRQLLVYELVSVLASDAPRPASQHTLKTAAEVRAMVSWRHVILPLAYFPSPGSTPLLARRPGVTDLYVVNDEWNHYDAGELAAVINVLPGETFENRIKHSQEVDTLTSTTTQTTTSQTTEQDQTMSTSLSQSSSTDASMNIGVQGQVQASGQFGLTQIKTSLGAQLQTSQSQADSKASTTAYQTVQRAVKTVSQTVTTIQSQRTVVKDSSYDDHKLQNTGDQVTVGMYRWLTEIHYVQLVRYPNRFVLEFEIPEPGAWLRWALQNTPTTGWDNPDPGPFTMLAPDNKTLIGVTPAAINSSNWMALAAQWRVQGLNPPPPEFVTLSLKLTGDPNPAQSANVQLVSDDSLTVPSGYQATWWTAEVVARMDASAHIIATDVGAGVAAGTTDPSQDYTDIVVTVGGSSTSLAWASQTVPEADPNAPDATVMQSLTGTVGQKTLAGEVVEGVKSGTIPVTVYAYDKFVGFSCVVNVLCEVLPESYAQWQASTFDQVAAAYQNLLNAFHQERDTRNQQVSGLADLTGSPELNLSRAANELKRMVIQDLMGQEMAGEDDVQTGPSNPAPFGPDEPYVPAQPLTDTDSIQFFEQAFEWENLVYICYPYYWARHSQWVTDVTSASADPVFDQFLNAGSARVVVPARPGFEDLVLFYIYTGLIWGGSQPPAPNHPDYLSIAQEIEALEKGATDGTPISPSWQISLPTTLLWAGTDTKTLPTNGAATIPAPPTPARLP